MSYKEELIHVVNLCIDRLYEEDFDLIKIKASERAIVFRFGLYLNEHCKELGKYHIDVEYNRSKKNIKRVHNEPAIPDLIIHKRMTNGDNLLVIEFKTFWNEENAYDIKKLKEFTSPDGKYQYQYGLSIILGKTRGECSLTWFNGGEINE